MTTDTDAPAHECETCGEVFVSADAVKGHKQVHTADYDHNDPAWLAVQYHDERLSHRAIGARAGVHRTSIDAAMARFGTATLDPDGARMRQLREQYAERYGGDA